MALHEATDTLHWVMCLGLYLPGGMVVAIAVDFVTFYYIVNNSKTLMINNHTIILMI